MRKHSTILRLWLSLMALIALMAGAATQAAAQEPTPEPKKNTKRPVSDVQAAASSCSNRCNREFNGCIRYSHDEPQCSTDWAYCVIDCPQPIQTYCFSDEDPPGSGKYSTFCTS
jgi:hypothetical protein